ncbi:glycosyltransferase family 2 protein [Methylomonas sp. HW2-6]|uniref:glycosyltransferase family 2 protein n=1 Tax=Methylomonas sp. HW2-6 TaxID=3376687 RepID=UPI00404133E6
MNNQSPNKINRLTPKVTIGLPVYNGERYLDACINSLLAQNYKNFSIIISDNASNDSTGIICRRYAETTPNIRYIRHEINRGASWNFNYVFCESTKEAKYFMWAAHDDLWKANYIERCVDELENNPDAVACGCEPCFINADGEIVYPLFEYNKLDTRYMLIRDRVRELVRIINWYSIYSVIRVDALKKTNLTTERYGSDVILLLELLLLGQTLIVEEKLFLYRLSHKTALEQMQDVCPNNASTLSKQPYTNLCAELLKTIDNSDLHTDTIKILTTDLLISATENNLILRKIILFENIGIIPQASRFIPLDLIAKILINIRRKNHKSYYFIQAIPPIILAAKRALKLSQTFFKKK